MGVSSRSLRDQLVDAVPPSRRAIVIFVLTLLTYFPVRAQTATDTLPESSAEEQDTLELPDRVRQVKDPKVATILSAILPGAGQAYNEKVWKVPIIYGGIITTAYFVEFNSCIPLESP